MMPFHLGQNLQEIQVAATMVDQLIFGDQIEEDPSFHLIPTPTRHIDWTYTISKSAGLAGVSSEMGLDDGLLVCTLLLLI